MQDLSVTPIRILLLDDNALVGAAGLKGVNWISNAGLNVVAEAGKNQAALGLVEKERPEIILFHEYLDHDDDSELLRKIMAVENPPRIILISGADDFSISFKGGTKRSNGDRNGAKQPADLVQSHRKGTLRRGSGWTVP